jgi:hypothetical protein
VAGCVPTTAAAGGSTAPRSSRGGADEVVDLDGAYVVRSYADGHTHWLEPGLADGYVAEHLRAGIFHVKDHLTSPRFRERMALGGAGSVALTSPHQGFTGPEGHPVELMRTLAGMGLLPAPWAESGGEGEAVFTVATDADVDRVWAGYVADRPDFVKVFLVHSDEHARRRGDAYSPKDRGIDPALVPGIVRRAHDAGLRVSAHAENAYDFHVAVTSGVDEIAHLPFVDARDAESYRPRDDDVARTRGMPVATTLEWLDEGDPDDARYAVTYDTMARLTAAGATLVVGTDLFRQTARVEADRLVRRALLTPTATLRSWSLDTPRACGRPDDEATFLVLGGDPLRDWSSAHDIRLRVQAGVAVVPGDAAFP